MYDEASGITADDAFKRTVWKWCIWSWPIGGLFFFVSFCLIAGSSRRRVRTGAQPAWRPLSWNGIIGFWIPEVCFAAGMTMTMVLLLKRFRYEESLAGPDRDHVGAASGDHRPVPAVGGAR